MNPADNIKRFFENASVSTNPKADRQILEQLLQANGQAATGKRTKPEPNTWRTIMHSKITKLAAAAVITIAAITGVTLVSQSVPAAYAIEQTIQANHTVRFLHVKAFSPDHNEPKEFWVQCDDFGNVINARMHLPQWKSPEDGAKVILWQNDKVQVYFKRKNMHFIANDQRVAQEVFGFIQKADPRFAVTQLRELEAKGEMKIVTETPVDKAELIIVTATYTQQPQNIDKKLVLFVDQATRLVTAIETYELRDGQYEHVSTLEYYDYNIPIEEKMFSLDDDVPSDATKIDQTIQEVGLVQGDMTNEEVAVEVARQFFEALIAEDYAKAGKLMEGVPAEFFKQRMGTGRFLKLSSVSPAQPHPRPETRGLLVQCKVEIEKDGQQITYEPKLGIREVFNQPGRWTIFGGDF